MFKCEASAVPEHEVFWTFTNSDGSTRAIISTAESDTDKYQVKRERRIGAGFGELTILDVQYEDRGRYTCTAMNSIGSDMSNANLTVHGEFLWLCCKSALRVGVVNRSHDGLSVYFSEFISFSPYVLYLLCTTSPLSLSPFPLSSSYSPLFYPSLSSLFLL